MADLQNPSMAYPPSSYVSYFNKLLLISYRNDWLFADGAFSSFDVCFPVHFSVRTDDFDVKAVAVTMLYLEFYLPPVFTKVVPAWFANERGTPDTQ